MELREAYEKYKKFKIPSLSVIYEKASQYSKTCLLIIVIFLLTSIYLMQQIPHWQVALFGINNSTELAQLENSYRATLAQILGGSAVAVGIYFAWKNIKIAQEGQITERFTRAIEQLGNEKMEIRLGGIYALERISNESEKDYWSIMEILTAYVRKNSPNIGIENEDVHGILKQNKISFDIQAILTVIRRRINSFNDGESNSLDLSSSYLGWADLRDVNLAGANLQWANLYGSGLQGANFEKAILEEVIFKDANLKGTNFQGTKLGSADFKKASLIEARFKEAELYAAEFQEADLQDANFEKASLGGAHLEGAKNLTIDQLSKVKTLYNATFDGELRRSLKEKYPEKYQALTNKPDQDEV